MRATGYNNHRVHAEAPGSISSHLLTLECVLDKYQHENELLTHKIAMLLQENQKLRHSQNQFHVSKVHDHTHNNSNQAKINTPQSNLTLYPSGQNNHTIKAKNFTVPNNISANPRTLSKTVYEQLSEDESKTERIRNFGRNQYEKSIKREKYSNEGIPYDEDIEARTEIENDKKTHRKGKQRAKTQQNSSPRKIIRIKKFTKEVYLEAETFYDEPSSERLPTFVEPSFGRQESKDKFVFLEKCKKQEKQREFEYEQIREYKIKQQENIEKGYFRLQMSHRQKQEILREKQKFIQEKRKQEEERAHLSDRNNELIEAVNGKKTNYPYKDTDFKLAEPKALLIKVSQGREVREERDQEKREKSQTNSHKKNRSIVNKIAKPTVLR